MERNCICHVIAPWHIEHHSQHCSVAFTDIFIVLVRVRASRAFSRIISIFTLNILWCGPECPNFLHVIMYFLCDPITYLISSSLICIIVPMYLKYSIFLRDVPTIAFGKTMLTDNKHHVQGVFFGGGGLRRSTSFPDHAFTLLRCSCASFIWSENSAMTSSHVKSSHDRSLGVFFVIRQRVVHSKQQQCDSWFSSIVSYVV